MIEIYTDGAYSSKTNNGGWAFVVVQDGNTIYEYAQGERETTNNRMELRAFIAAIEYAIKYQEICTIYSDSAYIINCLIEKWYVNWQSNNWKTYNKTNVKNKDLWEQVIQLLQNNGNIFFNKVEGHSDNQWNNRADKLAVKAREEI